MVASRLTRLPAVQLTWFVRVAAIGLVACWAHVSIVRAATRLEDICRVKGQEENTLHGLGLVVGLKGTGDGGSFQPMIRSLAQAMELMGNPIGKGELENAKNVALVAVTATIPPGGARQGDKLDCFVSSIGAAKSLAGGRLFVAPLQGPRVDSDRVYAFAQGPLELEDPQSATTGKITGGCRLEEDFVHVFTKDGKITLVIDKNHAGFVVADEIAAQINRQVGIMSPRGAPDGSFAAQFSEADKRLGAASPQGSLARAINQVNVEVTIPPQYSDDVVPFVSQVLSVQIREPRSDARVVINERTGAIAIDGDVVISPTVVTQKNITVETGAPLPVDRFVAVGPDSPPPKLDALVKALNAVKMPTEDIVQIIRVLERSGNLHGRVIIE